MLVHRSVIPSITFTGTHLYTWVRFKCLAQNTKQCPLPGLEPRPLDPETSALTTSQRAPHGNEYSVLNTAPQLIRTYGYWVQKCERLKRHNTSYRVLLTMQPLAMTLGLREVLEVAWYSISLEPFSLMERCPSSQAMELWQAYVMFWLAKLLNVFRKLSCV